MNKTALRNQFRLLRKNIKAARRLQAQAALLKKLPPLLSPYSRILSFASLPEEIDLSALNAHLMEQKKLYLPRLENGCLVPYMAIDGALERSSYNILEPIPSRSPNMSCADLDCVLVPGLCFDKAHHRLGFGLGCYDRFLASLDVCTFGIGFQEQYIDHLPHEPHDVPMTRIYLF